jgi:hypothetical protein
VPGDEFEVGLLGEHVVHAADDAAFDGDGDLDAFAESLGEELAEGEGGGEGVGVGVFVGGDEDVGLAGEEPEELAGLGVAAGAALDALGGVGDGLDAGFDECGHGTRTVLSARGAGRGR